MKVMIEAESTTEAIEFVRLVNRLEIAKYVISEFEKVPFIDINGKDVPCTICGGFGHNPNCKWEIHLNYVKKRLGLE